MSESGESVISYKEFREEEDKNGRSARMPSISEGINTCSVQNINLHSSTEYSKIRGRLDATENVHGNGQSMR